MEDKKQDNSRNVALVFDVDFTLINGYHPSITLAKRGVDVPAFWRKVSERQRREEADGEKTNKDIIYLAYFLNEVRNGKLKGLTLEEIREHGKDLEKMLYPGLPEFFDNAREINTDLKISYNLVSAGIKPMLENSVLARYTDKIYGYTFFDDLNPENTEKEIEEVKSTTSSHEKVASIIGISYGAGDGSFEYPIKNMIYFGDGETDKPAFKFILKRDGNAFVVFDPDKKSSYEKAQEIHRQIPKTILAPANYTAGSELWNQVEKILKNIK